MRFPETVAAWGGEQFGQVFKREFGALDAASLHLEKAMSASNYPVDADIELMLIGAHDQGEHLLLKVGLFFPAILAGCSCAGDPTPVDLNAEYCEAELRIDKSSAVGHLHFLD